MAARSEDFEEAARLARIVPETEWERPCLALKGIAADRVRDAVAKVMEPSTAPKEKGDALMRLQDLASPPLVVKEAEKGLLWILAHAEEAPVAHMAEAALREVWNRSGDDDADAAMKRAAKAMQDGDMLDAAAFVTTAVELVPGYAEGFNKRGASYLMAERHDDAIADFRRAIELQPSHYNAMSGLGLSLLRQGNGEGAHWLRASLEVHPRNDNMRQLLDNLEARSSMAMLQPRVVAVARAMKRGEAAPTLPASFAPTSVHATWEAYRVRDAEQETNTYYFRVCVQNLGSSPLCGIASYYVLRQADGTVVPLSRVLQGPSAFDVAPGGSYNYSYMISLQEELGEACGGLLLRCGDELFEAPLEALPLDGAVVVPEEELPVMNEGFAFMGRAEIVRED